MRIIVRTIGERTTDECIRRASLVGEVDVIENVTPFSAVLRATYEHAMHYNQEWVPVIDADVLLYPGRIQAALDELLSMTGVFCLDGKTDDKILCCIRRAGIHIYYRPAIADAIAYIKESIKPETRVRQAMQEHGKGRTYVSQIVFGLHDYDQYYRDLWRKSYLQTQKMGRTIRKATGRSLDRWPDLSQDDPDYRVILAAHQAGRKHDGEIPFDAAQNFGADGAIAALGLREKRPL